MLQPHLWIIRLHAEYLLPSSFLLLCWTEGGLGTLQVYSYSVRCDIYGLLIHKSHMYVQYIGAKVLLTELSHLVAAATRRRGLLQRRV